MHIQKNKFLTEACFRRLSITWLGEPYGGTFRDWRGSGWSFLQVWRIRIAVKWAYE